jgi:hypothetical protein
MEFLMKKFQAAKENETRKENHSYTFGQQLAVINEEANQLVEARLVEEGKEKALERYTQVRQPTDQLSMSETENTEETINIHRKPVNPNEKLKRWLKKSVPFFCKKLSTVVNGQKVQWSVSLKNPKKSRLQSGTKAILVDI